MFRFSHFTLILLIALFLQVKSFAGTMTKGVTPLFEKSEITGQHLTKDAYANYEIRFEYKGGGEGNYITLTDGVNVALDPTDGKWRQLRIAYEHPHGKAGLLSVWQDGKALYTHKVMVVPPRVSKGTRYVTKGNVLPTDRDFTVISTFKSQGKGSGTLWAKASSNNKWSQGGRTLYLRKGQLIFDVGWAGNVKSSKRIQKGKTHTAIVRQHRGKIELYLDGEMVARGSHSKKDPSSHVFKIGTTARDFGGTFKGEILSVRAYNSSLSAHELKTAIMDNIETETKPVIDWQSSTKTNSDKKTKVAQYRVQPQSLEMPRLDGSGKAIPTLPYYHPGVARRISLKAPSATVRGATIQPLGLIDHAREIKAWNQASFERGKKIYATLCVTCHGTLDHPGSLPTALIWHQGKFKNGNDPYSMYTTVSSGFGQMLPQPQYSSRQKYDVIHYIREAFVKQNPDRAQYFKITDEYLAALPAGISQIKPVSTMTGNKRPYQRMNFGPALFWTYQINRNQIAQKGIAIRLDPIGAEPKGGISKGKAWVIYDHDTMHLAAAWTGDSFINWRGIAFDGSHGTHTAISGEQHIANPIGPGWAHPKTQSFKDDQRLKGRDGRYFGPLPRDWAHYKGAYYHEDGVAISYTVGQTSILESPSLLESPKQTVFVRNLQIGPRKTDMLMRVALEARAVVLIGQGAKLTRDGGYHLLAIPSGNTPIHLRVLMAENDQAALNQYAKEISPLTSLDHLTQGGRSRWPEKVTTQIKSMDSGQGFDIERLSLPHKDTNPWASWMRMGGFDFYPDGKSAVICTWLGDVFLVKGVDGSNGGTLTWKRIATGLFQPLGVKIVKGKIYITCRDQLARLHDLNGDDEIDYIESFNNDHQVTEHFHEFAMGLQTDDEGNFYYAKSARHAKPALVPHHGTLLKVSVDGSRTDIVANGFRAANGVCVNGDGTFYVTDQEGHWTPKNRINLIKPGGFYGNWMGYHNDLSNEDAAMEKPLIWITNGFDRSPSELMWLKGVNDQWGPLRNTLINLSYGYGKAYSVMPENVDGTMQGAMCALPIPDFPTGIMRGRIHPKDGNLYVSGLFAWAGTQKGDGGFFRIKATGKPSHMPIAFSTHAQGVSLSFTEKLDPDSAGNAKNFTIEVWDLVRSRKYGSKHQNQRELKVTSAKLLEDGKTITLNITGLKPTRGMSIKCQLKGADGKSFTREIHATIHKLGK